MHISAPDPKLLRLLLIVNAERADITGGGVGIPVGSTLLATFFKNLF